MRHVDVDLFEHREHHRLFLSKKRSKKMQGGYLIMAPFNCKLMSAMNRLLCLGCVVIEWCHICITVYHEKYFKTIEKSRVAEITRAIDLFFRDRRSDEH